MEEKTLKVSDPSQPKKIRLFKIFFVFAVILALLWVFGVIPFERGNILGALDIGYPNATSSIGSVASSSEGIVFPANSSVSVRIFKNLGSTEIHLAFGSSTALEGGNGGWVIGTSTINSANDEIVMTLENGLLHRGKVYASSTGELTDNLRLFQY